MTIKGIEPYRSVLMSIMNALIRRVDLEEMVNYREETGDILHDLLMTEMWSVSRTDAKSSGIVCVEFSHIRLPAVVIVREAVNSEGKFCHEVEMIELPEPLRKITEEPNDLKLAHAQLAQRIDLPSMKDSPKPEGFGAFE